MICALYYESLIVNLFDKAGIDDWEYTQGVVLTKCRYNLPSVFFLIDGYWVEARGEDYLFDYSGDGDNCILFIMPVNSPMNIIGMPVFVDYYSIHDAKTGIVSWAPHTNSVKSDLEAGRQPTGKFLKIGDNGSSLNGTLASFGIQAGFLTLFILLWRYYIYDLINDNISNIYLARTAHMGYFAACLFGTYYFSPVLVGLLIPSESSYSVAHSSRNSNPIAVLLTVTLLGFILKALYNDFFGRSTSSSPKEAKKQQVRSKTTTTDLTKLLEQVNERLAGQDDNQTQ